mgnify:CR=1 FL=1
MRHAALLAGVVAVALCGAPSYATDASGNPTPTQIGGSGGSAAGDSAGATGVASAPGGRPGGTGIGGPHLAVPSGDDYSGSTPQAVQAQVDAIKDAQAVVCRRAAELVCRSAATPNIRADKSN